MSGWKRCNSNKGTGGMECSVVLFKPRINMFACTHPSVSNSLDCNDWLAYKHQPTVCVQTRLDYGSLLNTSISFHPVFQKPCVSNTFELWILVCVHASVSSLVKPVWMGIPFYKHQSPALPDSSPVFKLVWIMVACPCTRICQQPFVSNTFVCGFCLLTNISLEPQWLRLTWIIPCKCLGLREW